MRATALALVLIPMLATTADCRDTDVTKQWGTVDVTLKAYSIDGELVRIGLLMFNNADDGEPISSLVQFSAVSGEGDIGEMDFAATRCDAEIPPHSPLKCSLAYRFPTTPSSVNLTVGVLDRVYIRIGGE